MEYPFSKTSKIEEVTENNEITDRKNNRYLTIK